VFNYYLPDIKYQAQLDDKIMTKFDRTRWAEKGFGEQYLETADIRVVERKRLLAILKSFYRHFLVDKQQCRVLDLGCGVLRISGSLRLAFRSYCIQIYRILILLFPRLLFTI
jgi:hypothetical protein